MSTSEPHDPYAAPTGGDGGAQPASPSSPGAGAQPSGPEQGAAGAPSGQPHEGGPQYGSPQYGAPQYGAPQYGSPQYGSPQYGAAQPQYGAPQYGSPYPYAQPGFGSTEKNDLGIWALVLGIASFVLSCMFLTGIPAIILGRKAQRAADEGRANNRGMATAGLVLGWVAVGLSVAGVLLFGVLLAVGAFSSTGYDSYSY
ncbi:DUF4190 domain-containing protein [Cellulomonas massiliensis]|uniref:DUF4190 domain-containing protein n=1 Tax=Cellulomonas massiliensis TaxID=1465811 RepID=UPI00030FBF63|nr:DUF4190 domain-containing protein [Cellulomonas massiliensis]